MERSKVFDVFRSNPIQERSIVDFRRSFIGVSTLLASLLLILLIALVGAANYSQQISFMNSRLGRILVDEVESMGYSAPGDSSSLHSSDAADDGQYHIGHSLFSGQSDEAAILPDALGGIRLDESLAMPRSTSEDKIIATVSYGKTPDGDVSVNASATNLDYDVLEEALDIALADAQRHPSQVVYGGIGMLGLRYSAFVGEEGEQAVVFASSYFIQQSMGTLLISFGIPALIAIVAFFFLSVLLSYISSRPLEEAWKQQKRFIADASHELKLPLAVIKASNALIAEDPAASVGSRQRWVQSIDAESGRMLEMVNDMLYLARAGVSLNEAKVEMVDFSNLVMGMVLNFESIAFEKQVELAESIAEGAVVKGNHERLERLVGTLIDNAIKYSGSGGHVKVTLTSQTSICVLKVNNDGALIPVEDLPHVFERFYRADKARNRQTGGFGLGLAIAQELTQEAGGLITALSSPEDGTSFIVRLPLAKKR